MFIKRIRIYIVMLKSNYDEKLDTM